jgi:peptide/nickel transport system substrate-binding protein
LEAGDCAAISALPAATGSDPAAVVGTGPFKLEEAVLGEYVTFTRYEEYWDGRPNLERLVWQHVPGPAETGPLLLTGEIDLAGGGYESVDPGNVPQLEDGGLTVVPLVQPDWLNLMYNLDPEKTPLFQDVRVRQALLHALDREAMVETLTFGYGDVTHGFLSPAFWAANPDGITVRYPYDPDLAAQLLDEAGWVVGADGVRELDGQRLSFPLTVGTAEIYRDAYELMLEQWRLIGVEMELVEVQDLVSTWEQNDYIASLNIFGGNPIDQGYIWGCDGSYNFTHYCNPAVDEVLATISVEADRERLVELLAEMQNLVLADLPVAPLYYRPAVAASSERVHNFFPGVVNQTFNIETWWVDG